MSETRQKLWASVGPARFAPRSPIAGFHENGVLRLHSGSLAPRRIGGMMSEMRPDDRGDPFKEERS